jgi:hypothetical protein
MALPDEFDKIISSSLANDPALMSEARELMRAIMTEARRALYHGTPQMKAALMSKGLNAILKAPADQDSTAELEKVRQEVSALRESLIGGVVGTVFTAPAPTDGQ